MRKIKNKTGNHDSLTISLLLLFGCTLSAFSSIVLVVISFSIIVGLAICLFTLFFISDIKCFGSLGKLVVLFLTLISLLLFLLLLFLFL